MKIEDVQVTHTLGWEFQKPRNLCDGWVRERDVTGVWIVEFEKDVYKVKMGFSLINGGLLWIEKGRVKDKTYTLVSVWWKTKN
jgi:hypothetical protein